MVRGGPARKACMQCRLEWNNGWDTCATRARNPTRALPPHPLGRADTRVDEQPHKRGAIGEVVITPVIVPLPYPVRFERPGAPLEAPPPETSGSVSLELSKRLGLGRGDGLRRLPAMFASDAIKGHR